MEPYSPQFVLVDADNDFVVSEGNDRDGFFTDAMEYWNECLSMGTPCPALTVYEKKAILYK